MTARNKIRSNRSSSLLSFLLMVASNCDLSHSLLSPSIVGLQLQLSATSLRARPRDDDFYSSRNTNNRDNNNVGKEDFQRKSSEDFRQAHGSTPPSSGWGRRSPFNDNTIRQPFQTSSTDDFKRPFGSVPNNNQQQSRPRGNVFKSPFQTSTTDAFRRASDVESGVGAPQQTIFNSDSRSTNSAWQNNVGKDSYESTKAKQPPKVFIDAQIIDDEEEEVSIPQPQPTQATPPIRTATPITPPVRTAVPITPPIRSAAPITPPVTIPIPITSPITTSAPMITPPITAPVTTSAPTPPKEKSAPLPASAPIESPINTPTDPTTPEDEFEQWDKKLEVAQQSKASTLIHNIKWPLVRDPPGVSPEYPLLVTRILVTMFATLSSRYWHLYNGYSPVLAASAMTLLVSLCLDRRLGQSAFCGSIAGMCGGHITPTLSMAVALGGVTSICYELLIHINNLCLGIGGRLGSTSFLATSILAKYQGVSIIGRKLRRGLWKNGAGPSNILVTMILYSVIGSLATIYLRECSDDSAAADPLRASSVVGIVGSLFLKDPTAVLALYGGTMVGMSLPSRLMHGNAPGQVKANQPQTALSLLASFAGAGAIAGLIHAITIHNGYWNGGWGGKAGLCAFAGCWAYRGLGNIYQFIQKRK
ncbi:hypothetical protein ACHAWU_003518 [Discostella pseudostelligera]|uniref:Uncharacterized protein n=1 Tax=Discostella pseudostelligera TaxID=259834 RepID=A0ABD3LYE9_9STRA